MAAVGNLEKYGWYLNPSAVQEYFPGKDNADEIIKLALDLDLRQIGQSHIPESTWKSKTETVEGPLVLQLQKLRNVCVSKEGVDTGVSNGGPQLLRLTLTDGQRSICALDMDNISGLSLNTPPGSKLKIIGKASVCNGYLLLFRANCKVLGGHVQSLIDNWNLKRSLAAHSRDSGRPAAGDGGPPPFIPFGQRGKVESPQKNVNFKSLDIGGKKKEADSEFEQQRKATIEAALQQQAGHRSSMTGGTTTTAAASNKQSSSDRDLAAIVEMGFTIQQASAALQRSGGNLNAALNSLLPAEVMPSSPLTSTWPQSQLTASGRATTTNDSRTATEAGPSVRNSVSSDGPLPRQQPDRLGLANHCSDTAGQGDRPGGRRGQRRVGGHTDRDDDSYGTGRPSAPATLFDFVTSKMRQPAPVAAAATETATETAAPPAAEAPPPPPLPSPSSDRPRSTRGPLSAPPSGSGGGVAPSQLPPRLQRKQQQAEEEKFLKYYKPMDYMRQTNAYHRSSAAVASATTTESAPRPRENVPRSSGGGRPESSHRIQDFHSRGSVRNRKLWTDDGTGSGNNNNSHQESGSGGNWHENCQDVSSSSAATHSNRFGLVKSMDGAAVHNAVRAADGIASVENAMSDLGINAEASGQQVAKGRVSSGTTSRRWKVGDTCLAKYWQDGKMYKAQIQDITGQRIPRFTILFVDYGNQETVSHSDICELNEPTWEMSRVYTTQDGPCMVAPVTLAHGANIVYQPNALTAPDPTAGASGGSGGTYYFPPPYIQMPPANMYESAHAVHVTPSNLAHSNTSCPVPGILVQGPPIFPVSHQQTPAQFHSNGGASAGAAGPENNASGRGNRSSCLQPAQVYIPPPQRK